MIESVGFTGHREYDNEAYVAGQLAASIERALAAGASWFASGGAAGADELFLKLALELRDDSSPPWYDGGVGVAAYIPFPEFRKGWTNGQLSNQVDMIVSVNKGPYEVWKMFARNHFIVDNSDVMVAVYDGRDGGGTLECLRYSRRKGLPIFWIDPAKQTTQWVTGG